MTWRVTCRLLCLMWWRLIGPRGRRVMTWTTHNSRCCSEKAAGTVGSAPVVASFGGGGGVTAPSA
jgi:hypothetical protein